MTFKGTLYPYQQEASESMVDRGQMLLGMVMGAGKTPTTLHAVEKLDEMGEIDRCLVVVPASLKFQWLKEIGKFTDARAVVISGTKAQRTKQWRTASLFKYVIVNAETLRNDEKLMGRFECIVVDEATVIKNRTTKRTRLLKRLGNTMPYRFALTGQPIENRPEELFSIMEFVDKGVLGSFANFDATFIIRDRWGKATRYRNLDVMHAKMQDCMIRKTREDIKDQLPDIIHQVIQVPFDPQGATAYRRISQDLLEKLQEAIQKGGKAGFDLFAHYNGGEGGEAQGEIMTRLTALRMLCDNPALVNKSAQNYNSKQTKDGSKYAAQITKAGWLDKVTAAPKLDACMEYVEEVLAEHEDNKVVIFSFFKDNLRALQDTLKAKGVESVLFMGGMSDIEKDKAKTKFGTSKKCKVFLSSDAGGYGVDLPMANYLISYDLPWSSGKLEQREARIIRLSSEFPHVTIASFVMAGSIEERQYEMLQQKKAVNEAFVDGKHHDVNKGMELNAGSLTAFLKDSDV
jgi:SNF2 family DNA or RNA helicase